MTSASSWKELIQEVERSKKSLPWEGMQSVMEPVKYVNLREVKLKEREVNPVLMCYRDETRQKNYEQQQRECLSGRGRKEGRSNGNNSMFQLISHSLPARANPVNEARTSTKYHILSKLLLEKHATVPTLFNESLMLTELHKTENKVTSKPKIGGHRHNILSNQFMENHEETTAMEKKRLQKQLEEAYWRTHSFDPIRQTPYHAGEEKELLMKEEEAKREQGAAQTKRLPAS